MKLKQLSNEFYSTYNQRNYPNILRKKTRTYAIYQIVVDGITIGIPIKSDVKHSSSFLIKQSGRHLPGKQPGLDFKSSIVLSDLKFVDVDGTEMKYLFKNEEKIRNQYVKFLNSYKKFVRNPLSKCWDSWRFSHTSLEYFWKELNILVDDEIAKKEEIELSYNLYLILKNLQKDLGMSSRDFFIRKTSLSSVSVSYHGVYILKDLKLSDIHNYIAINTFYDENNDIKHKHILCPKYNELVNFIKSNILKAN